MKKLSYLLSLFVITGLLFSSCTKDDEPNTPPTVSFLGGIYEPWGIERTDSDVTMETGKPLVFGFTASSTTDKNLSRILITRNYENVSLVTVLDSAISVPSYTLDIETVSYPNPGSEVFEITITDKNGLSSTINFTVTSTMADPGINIHTDVSLGSFNSATNSSFASITGETFSLADAEDPAVQSKISWIYFHGVTYGHTVMSPANDAVEEVYPAVADWTNRNATLLSKTVLNTEAFDLIVNKNQLIITVQNSGASLTEDFYSELQSNPGGFEVDDILAFETHDGHQGLLKITEVNPGASNGESTIKYDVKVEK